MALSSWMRAGSRTFSAMPSIQSALSLSSSSTVLVGTAVSEPHHPFSIIRREFGTSGQFEPPPISRDPGAIYSFRPRRGLLYMPSDDPKKVTKAASQIDVDVVCMDCEDAVAASRKQEARECVAGYLEKLDFGKSERAVRINPLASGLAEADLEAVLGGPVLPDAIVVPKVGSPVDLQTLVPKVKKLIGHRVGGAGREPVKLITMCESAMGLLNLRETLEAALHLGLLGHRGSPLHLEACILGGDDFAASVGATRTTGSLELLYARQCFLTHCHAYGIQPLDIVQINYRDLELLRHEATEGAQMGFEGKQVIHPGQVPVVQEVFSPSEGAVAGARELVEAFLEHQGTGTGTFVFKGQMIDNPTVLQARNTLARAGVSVP